jgi:hypothetical protein
MSLFDDIWKFASNELQLDVKMPFDLKFQNKVYYFPIYIKHFGSKNGMILIPIEQYGNIDTIIINEIKRLKYYISFINIDSYKKYNKQEFIDTLNDWGWFGFDEHKPKWYTGKAWSK